MEKDKSKTGIDGQKKLFRKSLSTIATDTLVLQLKQSQLLATNKLQH